MNKMKRLDQHQQPDKISYSSVIHSLANHGIVEKKSTSAIVSICILVDHATPLVQNPEERALQGESVAIPQIQIQSQYQHPMLRLTQHWYKS